MTTTPTNGHQLPKLEDYRISSLENSFYYIPSFISSDEEAELLSKIKSKPWVQLSRRRLQVYPAQLTPKNTLLAAQPMPEWLTAPVLPSFRDLGIFSDTPHAEPNHCLVNAYRPGEGIMPHEDGDAYASVVATVSLGTPIVLDIYAKNEQGEREALPKWRILQEKRSLLVTRDEAYVKLLHGIADVAVDKNLDENDIANWSLLANPVDFDGGELQRRERISLTFRDVLKVSTLGGKLFGTKR